MTTYNPHLFVVYDDDCGFCQRIMDWFRERDTLRNCDFIPSQTPNLRARWPQLSLKHIQRGIQAILLNGQVVKNETAVAACLFQIREYRWLAKLIMLPFIKPFAAFAYRIIAILRR